MQKTLPPSLHSPLCHPIPIARTGRVSIPPGEGVRGGRAVKFSQRALKLPLELQHLSLGRSQASLSH